MDGGGDNQLAARSFWIDAFNYFEGVPAHNIPPPDPAQGEANADALHVALHALFLSELSDLKYESISNYPHKYSPANPITYPITCTLYA